MTKLTNVAPIPVPLQMLNGMLINRSDMRDHELETIHGLHYYYLAQKYYARRC